MSQVIQQPDASTEKASSLVSIFAGVGIGIMIGLLLGLAAPASPDAKTVVSVFIGAVGVGLAALLGLDDRHFSNTKGLRIGAFGLSVALSAMAGIYVRDHGLISPGLEERAEEVRAVFPSLKGEDKDDRVIAILSAMDSSFSKDGNEGKVGITLRSNMYSGKEAAKSVCEKLQLRSRTDTADTATLTLRDFRYYDKDGKLGWKRLADFAEANLPEQDIKNFLLLSRDAVCGSGVFSQSITLTKSQCKDTDSPSIDWQSRLSETDKGRELLVAIRDEKIPENSQKQSLGALAAMLCN